MRKDAEEYLAVVLTAPGDVDAYAFNRGAAEAWHHFFTLMRQAYPGADLQFWKVAEEQERGHVHFHFVLRGLRFLRSCRTPYRRWKANGGDCGHPVAGPNACAMAMASRAGFGWFVGIKRPRDYPGGVRSVGAYFGKYLLKNYQQRIGVTRLVTMSQKWRVDWVSPAKAHRGEWVFGGYVGQGWGVLGQFIEGERGQSMETEYFASWWDKSWQRARRDEALSMEMPVAPSGSNGQVAA